MVRDDVFGGRTFVVEPGLRHTALKGLDGLLALRDAGFKVGNPPAAVVGGSLALTRGRVGLLLVYIGVGGLAPALRATKSREYLRGLGGRRGLLCAQRQFSDFGFG